uniref:Uncharacterized protein n=1 Tax=Arion vulgaris TaxID=1028688 RepID=A0A0B7AD52_9EUPU
MEPILVTDAIDVGVLTDASCVTEGHVQENKIEMNPYADLMLTQTFREENDADVECQQKLIFTVNYSTFTDNTKLI